MTHHPATIAQAFATPQPTVTCRQGCDLNVAQGDHIREVGWDEANLTVHLRSWTRAHVDALPPDVARLTITLYCDDGHKRIYILTR
jgi:hypothetical protein